MIKVITKINILAPTIDQTTGKSTLPAEKKKSSGRLRALASQDPIKAPKNPTPIESRQPPLSYPEIACAIAPQRPATINNAINSRKPMIYQVLVKVLFCKIITYSFLLSFACSKLFNFFSKMPDLVINSVPLGLESLA